MSDDSNNNIIYIHICCINNYREIFREIMFYINNSGLYDKVREIRCCILGALDNSILIEDKLKIRASSCNLSLYETFTINTMYEDCKHEDMNILYLHTKGVTRGNSVYIAQWREYLCYFNIYRYITCLELLKHNDAVGVSLYEGPELHYSGNFWWSKSEYIRKLKPCVQKNHNSPEFWLTEKRIGLYRCLWHSGVHHYDTFYPRELYKRKINIT